MRTMVKKRMTEMAMTPRKTRSARLKRLGLKKVSGAVDSTTLLTITLRRTSGECMYLTIKRGWIIMDSNLFLTWWKQAMVTK